MGLDNLCEFVDDFSLDIEIFVFYLNVQLNGSVDLGVEWINDFEMCDFLISIQFEYDVVLKLVVVIVLKNLL